MTALLIHPIFTFIYTVSCVAERNHWGNEFVIPFLSNFEKKGIVYVYMMARVETSVFVEIPWENREEFLTILPDSRGSVSLPWDIRYEEDLVVTKKAVYINSTHPIAVYGFSYVSNSAASFLAIPVDVLGDHYLAVSYIRSVYDTSVVVAAVEHNTEVTFHYNLNGGTCGPQAYMNGDTSTHTLNRLDVIGIHCSKDLTGTEVTSSKPVSVVSGNVGGKIPLSKGGRDIVEEMMIPVKDFGKDYVLTNAGRSAGTINRLVAVENNTEVTSSTENVYHLMKSEFVDIDTDVDGEQCIKSNKSILVVAFGKGLKANSDNLGDPLMTVIPPVNRYHHDYLVEFNLNSDVNGFAGSEYLTVVGELSDIPYLESVLSAPHTSLAKCSYGVIHTEVTTWPVQLNTPNTTRLGAQLYGVGGFMGVGMALGMVFEPQYCWSSTCDNNAVCEEINESFVCHCDTGYTGDRCQTVLVTSSTPEITSTHVEYLHDISDTPLTATPLTDPQTIQSSRTEDTFNLPLSTHWSIDSEVLLSTMLAIPYTESQTQDLSSTIEYTTYIHPLQTGPLFNTIDPSLLSPDDSEHTDFVTPTHVVLNSDMSALSASSSQYSTDKTDSLMPSTPDRDESGDTYSVTSSTVQDEGPEEVIHDRLSSKAVRILSAGVVIEVCTCMCKGSRLDVLEANAVKAVTDEIQSQLLLNTRALSKTIRKRISAPDDRISAKNVGAMGIALLAITFSVMVIPDILSTFRAVFRYFKKRYRTGPSE